MYSCGSESTSHVNNSDTLTIDKDSEMAENIFLEPADSLHVIGTIVEIVPGYCGVTCSGGCIKVKPDNKVPNYTLEHIYLITACMDNRITVGTKIDVMSSMHTSYDKECYYLHYSTIDSVNAPLFKLSESESRKIK